MGWEELVGLGLAAAGAATSTVGAAQSQRAMNNTYNDVTNTELQEQAAYRAKGAQLAASGAQQATPGNAQTQIDTGKQGAAAMYKALQGANLSPSLTGITAMDPVTQARSDASIGQQNDAASTLQGFQNFGQQQSLSEQATNRGLAGTGVESSTNAQAMQLYLQQQMQKASQKGAPLQAIGGGLSALGSLAGLAGIGSSLASAGSTAYSSMSTAEPTYSAFTGLPTGETPTINAAWYPGNQFDANSYQPTLH